MLLHDDSPHALLLDGSKLEVERDSTRSPAIVAVDIAGEKPVAYIKGAYPG